jgi:hypothetical protein
VRGEIGERAVESSHRRARCADNDDIVLHSVLLASVRGAVSALPHP